MKAKGSCCLFQDWHHTCWMYSITTVRVIIPSSGTGMYADTIAFGDAKVDIPLFRCCAYSVCMGSGGAEAKAAADYVTGDVDKDGLFQAFRYLGLMEPSRRVYGNL